MVQEVATGCGGVGNVRFRRWRPRAVVRSKTFLHRTVSTHEGPEVEQNFVVANLRLEKSFA